MTKYLQRPSSVLSDVLSLPVGSLRSGDPEDGQARTHCSATSDVWQNPRGGGDGSMGTVAVSFTPYSGSRVRGGQDMSRVLEATKRTRPSGFVLRDRMRNEPVSILGARVLRTW